MTRPRGLTDTIHNGSLQRGLLLAILVMLGVGATAFLGAPHAAGARADAAARLARAGPLAARRGRRARASSATTAIACWR